MRTTSLPLSGVIAAAFLSIVGSALLGISHPQSETAPERGLVYFRLDLNDDGIDDFYVENKPMSDGDEMAFIINLRAKRDNEFVFDTSVGGAAALEEGTTIGCVLSDPYAWSRKRGWLFTTSDAPGYDPETNEPVYVSGPWASFKRKYLGLKLVEDGAAYYGWAYVEVDTAMVTNNHAKLLDYGMASEPGQPIRVGENRR